jgi:murein DD-endopeptidase MepM/ murein hydrolase activator NlpD
MLLATLAVAAAIVAAILWRVDKSNPRERIGFQDADFPLSMPESGQPDHRLHFLSAWQAARIPSSPRFDLPLGSTHGALVHKPRKFRDPDANGELHTGDDFDGIGGANTDLGDPVFATADGLVIYTGEPSPSWGKTIVLAHRTPTGTRLNSLYAHLDQIHTAPGILVARGARIGTVGTASGHHPAHLHLEILAADGVDIAGPTATPNRLDPSATIASLRNSTPDDLNPPPLAQVLANKPMSWTDMEIMGAEKFPGIPSPEPAKE